MDAISVIMSTGSRPKKRKYVCSAIFGSEHMAARLWTVER